MEELKALINEKTNLDDKLQEKANSLIEELIQIPHFEYLTYDVFDGMIYCRFIDSSRVNDKKELLEILKPKLKNAVVKYSNTQISFYSNQTELNLILSLSLEKDLKAQVSEKYNDIIWKLTKHTREKQDKINKAIEECKQRIEKLEKELSIVTLNKMYESNKKFI
jgi:hypothetical protein